ncbi:MAG: trimethylamine methyltransferase family protein [Syntrophaceticus schinkii]|jgi:trimethylamine--corrinoid protein Co-methyltransferase|nr:trimethylamine methyltransferase family protein [Syntrophaceticus schinkii]
MSIQSIESNYGGGHQSVHFKVLSDQQCEKIIGAALEILERTGVDINCEEALSLLKEAGCFIDGKRVRIPSYLIKKALQTAPSRVVLADRNGNRKLFLEGNNSYFGLGPTCPNFIDAETGERRKATKQDVVNTAVVADKLPNIDYVMSLSMISDHTPALADVHEVHAMLQYTTKPLAGWAFNAAGMQDIIDMCSVVAGSLEELQRNPFIVLYSEPTSPLTHSNDALKKLLLTAENRIPVVYTPGMIIGGTAPVTLAGALAVGVADNLTGLLLSQLKREGAPFIGAAPGGPMDMATMQHCYGAPELLLQQAASTDIYHYLKLPIWGTAGTTDSKIVDEQAAIDDAIQVFAGALSGAHLIHDVGFIDLGMTGSLEQMVLCDEIIGYVRRFVYGLEINDETLALEVVDQVGPGGQFLGTKHTFRNFKERSWKPTLFDRRSFEQWEKDGKKTMGQRVHEKVKQILDEHQPQLLPEEVIKQLDAIVDRAEARIKK